jgi:SAM-dependent methyltransferase
MAVERVSAASDSPWLAEHRSRYLFAGRYVESRTVLDVACGSGFGVPLLLRAGATRVVGVDSSDEALAEATRFANPAVQWLKADATQLPLADKSFDVVTSFETIEHIAEYEIFLKEVKRVIADNGFLILSTPNALHTQPRDGRPQNPFHVQEFTPSELGELLLRHFRDVELFGHRVHPHFRPCPFWESAEQLPRDLLGRFRVLLWKLLNRVPDPLGDPLTHRLWGRALLPGENEFVFRRDEVDSSHVIVAVCTNGT